MKRSRYGVLLTAAALTVLAGTAPVPSLAGGSVSRLAHSVPASGNEFTGLWFIELSGVPAADGGNKGQLKNEKAAFRAAARGAGVALHERYAFDTLFNGLSVAASDADIGKLRRLPGVKAVYPVERIQAPEPKSGITPDLYTAIEMTGASTAQAEGYTGKGVKVAVVDTGIDYDHKALGGDGVARSNSTVFPTARVKYGYDFVGDAFNADDSNPVVTPDPYPDDCAGHGTHVAGIIGADDPGNGLKGVAPEVTFGAYRVFGCEGSTTGDVMIAAMERALADGMQVLNMSIGSSFQWPEYPTAQAADRLVNKGVVVVASIGNSGANGLYSAGAPGVGKKVIGVASFDNTHVYLPYFTVNGQHIGYVTMTYSPNPPTSGSGVIADVGLACAALTPGSLTGKIALAARGTCSFGIKAANAINAGAIAVLISNNASGVFNGTLGAPIDGVTPVVGISLEDGNFIRAQAAPVTLTWTDQQGSFPSPTGGLISSFSSYGLSPDLDLKPDIGAPGGNIYSTYPLELGGYATLSGTSMASPHVAGTAALLLQAKPKTNAQVVRTILQNTAEPAVWWGNPGLGFLDNVHRQGAGMVRIDHAIMATTRVSPGKIAAGEGQAGPYKTTLTVENSGHTGVTYDLSYVNALSTGGVMTPSFTTSNATVGFNQPSVTVPAGGSAQVQVTITPATAPTFGQYGGYVVLTPQGGGQVYRVPFAGFVGDYQGIQTLTPTPYGFPWLAISYEGEFYGPVTGPADWTYTMVGEDIPFFLVHFDHQPEKFRMSVYDARGRAMHRAYDDRYYPRNSTATGFYAFPFDGTTVNGRRPNVLPDGEYYVVISVLKANGDENNPAHWENWTSPHFLIDRP